MRQSSAELRALGSAEKREDGDSSVNSEQTSSSYSSGTEESVSSSSSSSTSSSRPYKSTRKPYTGLKDRKIPYGGYDDGERKKLKLSFKCRH